MKLIVGLPNPGREYRETRHNVGFLVVDELARRHQLELAMGPSQVPETLVAKRYGPASVLVAKPLTFMNRSGDAVAALMRYYEVGPADVLVVVDEASPRCSMATDISALVAQSAFSALKGPIMMVRPPHTPVPFAPELEDAYIPSPADIAQAVRTVMGHAQ